MRIKILFVIFVMYILCLCGCSKREIKENPFIKSEQVTEEMISVPDNVSPRFDIMRDEKGRYLFLGKEKSGVDSLWRADSNNKWEVLASLPSEFVDSEVLSACFLDEKNYFFCIAYDFNKEGRKFETRNYFATATADSEMNLIELDEGITSPIKKDSKVFGFGKPQKIKAIDSKTGLLLKTYDQSILPVEMFFVTDDKIVAAGGGRIESYDIETAQIRDTKDSLIKFLTINIWQRGGACLFYDNDSEIVYCANSEGIFCYDMNSEKEYRPIQNENSTPYKTPRLITGLRIQENKLFLSIPEDWSGPRGSLIYVYTAK